MIKIITNWFNFRKKKDSWIPPERPELPLFYTERRIERIYARDYPAKRFSKFANFFILHKEIYNAVIFFDTTQNQEYSEYLINNKEYISEKLAAKGRNLIVIPDISSSTANINYKYFFPEKHWTFKNFDGIPKAEYSNFDQSLIEFLGYSGQIKTGVFSAFLTGSVFVEKLESESIDAFWNKYIDNMLDYSDIIIRKPKVFYSLEDFDGSEKLPLINVDDETIKEVDIIWESMKRLVESGNFFLVAPIIEQMIESTLNPFKISPIKISSDFRIFLPEYDLEIVMGHLTKAIYFLFLIVNEPIDIKDMSKFEDHLLNIYLEISNRNSYENLTDSVKAVVEPGNELIYMHISRIRSAFAKKFRYSYYSQYEISGDRGKPKSIRLDRKLVEWDSEIEFARLQK
ncbi:Uncharacterised protein [Chryseobacterium taklimakanense]|uniref:Uncharacterized protein n=1 Tax=Chryseobacterium taklimakanense TaxID=536441 RepID=A0A239X4F9_9FLAO|nr:hypothetical protein [Chryseobacterium taklimakanense]SNV41419.1 Uncharacterised protein [Chryseobacterium taklimakanense]